MNRLIRLVTILLILALIIAVQQDRISTGAGAKVAGKTVEASSSSSTTTTVAPLGSLADSGVVYRITASAGTSVPKDSITTIKLFDVTDRVTTHVGADSRPTEDFMRSWTTAPFSTALPAVLTMEGSAPVSLEIAQPQYDRNLHSLTLRAGSSPMPASMAKIAGDQLAQVAPPAFSKVTLYMLVPSVRVVGNCALAPYTHCEAAILFGEDLSHLDLTGAQLSGVNMAQATARGLNVSGADMAAAQFFRSDATGLVAIGTHASGLDAYQLSAPESNFKSADLSRSKLFRSDFREADFSDANLQDADLTDVDAHDARFDGARAPGAQFPRANLSGADLSGADLSGANLSYADLSGANLAGANLTGATLYGADMKGAITSGATFYRTTCPGGKVASRC